MSHWATEKTNVPAAVHHRLLGIAKDRGTTFDAVAVRYATERLLYRLSRSEHATRFVLKGAWLFYVWDLPRRTTRDVDLLGQGENSPERVEELICQISQLEVDPDDGLRFDPESADSQELQENEEYSGVRVRITAHLGTAEIRTQVDVGFGEALIDDPIESDVPALLDYPPPRLRAYSAEASIAEKLEAMVRFGSRNDRLKDYFDIYTLCRERSFGARKLGGQISATFARRETSIPSEVPTGLRDEFARDRQRDWENFLDDSRGEGVPGTFSDVVRAVREFVHPPMKAASSGQPLSTKWTPETGWE